MQEMKRESPNPAVKAGKLFTLAPHSFEDALRNILAAPPEPKPSPFAVRGMAVLRRRRTSGWLDSLWINGL